MTCIMLMAMPSSLAIKRSSDETRGQNDGQVGLLALSPPSHRDTQRLVLVGEDR